MTESTPQGDECRARNVQIAKDYLKKLAADKEAEREAKRQAAEEAEFKRYERRYGWTRAYYAWFCNRPRDEQSAILLRERQAFHRSKQRGGKPARAWQSLDGMTAAEKAERKQQQDRESYQRKKAAKLAEQQADMTKLPSFGMF